MKNSINTTPPVANYKANNTSMSSMTQQEVNGLRDDLNSLLETQSYNPYVSQNPSFHQHNHLSQHSDRSLQIMRLRTEINELKEKIERDRTFPFSSSKEEHDYFVAESERLFRLSDPYFHQQCYFSETHKTVAHRSSYKNNNTHHLNHNHSSTSRRVTFSPSQNSNTSPYFINSARHESAPSHSSNNTPTNNSMNHYHYSNSNSISNSHPWTSQSSNNPNRTISNPYTYNHNNNNKYHNKYHNNNNSNGNNRRYY